MFLAFASAAIRIRISGISSTMRKKVDKDVLQYNFGMLLKETMLDLGPTFIKSKCPFLSVLMCQNPFFYVNRRAG